jgi:hypothetical protein
MTCEYLDSVADDGHFTCGDCYVGAYPGFEFPVRRIKLRTRRSRLLNGFGPIGCPKTCGPRELFGGLSKSECLRASDFITGPIVPTGGQDSNGYISQVIARHSGDGAVASRTLYDPLIREPAWSPIKVESRAQERITAPTFTDVLFCKIVFTGMCESRTWRSG